MERKVVVTGLGVITPIGKNVEEFWKGIKENKCGIAQITELLCFFATAGRPMVPHVSCIQKNKLLFEELYSEL